VIFNLYKRKYLANGK